MRGRLLKLNCLRHQFDRFRSASLPKPNGRERAEHLIGLSRNLSRSFVDPERPKYTATWRWPPSVLTSWVTQNPFVNRRVSEPRLSGT